MPLTIFNGSPRNQKSNSKILAGQFLAGYSEVKKEDVPTYYLASRKKRPEQLEAYNLAETLILIFPLYTDSMPGIVKEFIEQIAALEKQGEKNIGFIVHSGFPEAIHSVYLERYLKKLAVRLGHNYLGTVIRGGVEGIQIMPSWMTRKLYKRFRKLGRHFTQTGQFEPKTLARLRKPYRLTPLRVFVMRYIVPGRFLNFYWIKNLKENKALANSFDRPYE